MNIKYILTHPIQYQSPLIKYLNKKINIDIAYRSNVSLRRYYDREFNKKIIINKKLLVGYKYVFLKHLGTNEVTNIKPFTTEFIKNIFTNNTKIVWLHGFFIWYNFLIILLAKIYKKKVFVRDETSDLKPRSFLKFFLKKIYYKFIDNFIDCYLSIGTSNRNNYINYGINSKKIFNVPYVVDNNYFFIKNKNRSKKLKILFTGKLIYKKGCDILLKSITLLNKDIDFKHNTEIIIVGDGQMKTELLNFVKKNNLNNVKFVGFKKQSLIKDYYKKTNLFIMPSREENWGLAINEAMASKNAIICSTSVGCKKDLVKNNYNGYIFKNDDYINLAQKILKIYNEPKKLSMFKKNSFKIISKWSFNECYIGLNKAIKYVQ
jgi:glycosyltransferase involved in cell wall biosynthesis